MSQDAAQQEEPSIEEILGSIRRIISEDDEPEVEEQETAAEPEQEAATESVKEEVKAEPKVAAPAEPEPEVAEEAEDDVLELTQMIEEDGNISESDEEPDQEEIKIDMLDDQPAPTPEPAPAPAVETTPVVEDLPPLPAEEDLVSEDAADVTAAVMAKLARSAAVTRKVEGIALEDMVRELLKPMLRQWLDDNLPTIVENMVERELEKIARRAKD